MRLNRTKNAKRNIVFGFLNKIITLVFPFILRTVIVKKMGAEFLGLGSLFASILQVLSLSELGIGSAIVFSMYKPIAEDDEATLGALLNFYRKLYLYIGLFILAAGLAVVPLLPRIIKGSIPDAINLYFLYFLYLLNSVISYFLFAYRGALLTAYQRGDVTSNINSIIFIVLNTVQLFVIIYTKNYYLYVGSGVVSTVVSNIVTACMTNKLFPKIKCKGDISKGTRKDIAEKVKGLMISKISLVTRNSLDSIVISAFLGLVETAIYNNYYYIMNGVSGFMVLIFSAMLSGIGNSIETDSVEKNYQDYRKFNFLYLWITGFCSICLFCLYQPFTRIFFGEEMLFPFYIMSLFCVYFFYQRIGDMIGLYYNAKGLWWKCWYSYVLETILNLVFNIVLGKYFGVAGIVLATIFSMLVTSIFFIPYVVYKYYFIGYSLFKYFMTQIFYFTVTVFVGAVTYFCCHFISIDGLFGLFIKLFVCIIVQTALYVLVYFKLPIFKIAIVWSFGLLKKK